MVGLVGYALVAGSIWLASDDRLGARLIPLAALVACFWPIVAIRDVAIPSQLDTADPGGWFRFGAGWPDEDSYVEHRLRWDLSAGSAPTAVLVAVAPGCDPLIRLEAWVVSGGVASSGPATETLPGSMVPVSMRSLGFASRDASGFWRFGLDPGDWNARGELPLRLRLQSHRSSCRLIAMRWTVAASAGIGASAVVSGAVREAGVFDPVTRVVRPGVLLIRPADVDANR